MKVIIKDPNSFYYNREADVISTMEILNVLYYRVSVGNVTFGIKASLTMQCSGDAIE